MINASKEFKEKLKKGAKLLNYADLTLNNGTKVHLEPEDFMVGGCQIEDKTTDGKFGVGFCIGKTITLRIANHDERFSDYDFYSSVINLYVAAQLDDGTIEMIRKGVYYTTVPQTPGDVIEISAVDSMHRLDRDYSESDTIYPATLQTIITEACMDCGIQIGFRQFDNMGFVVQAKPENAKYRQVVSYACQIAGYNARIDNDGYMQLVWYNTSFLDMRRYDGGDFKTWPHDTILDGGDFTYSTPTMIIDGGNFTDPAPENVYKFKSLNVSTDDIVITGVQVVGEENEAAAGESGYMIKLENNPFVNGKEQEVAAYLGARMIGLVFRAFSADVLNNPLYEPFEVARVYDRKGNMYLTIINSVSYTVGGYTQIACEAEDPVRNGSSFYSASAAAVVEARRNTKKQITEYDKAVQNMNQIAMNTLGYHATYEESSDGSRITYMHDKPRLEDSKTIYKIGIDGFFVSQDGGKSYTAGFDKNGTAVVNILYAIGIVADWIRSGRFVCQKGSTTTFLADVDTGQVIINADSIAISGTSVQSIASSAASSAVNGQTQQSIFNKLTNNGQAQGIYLQNGQLYVLFTYAKGGTLTLGGVNNTNGSMKILDSAGKQIGYWDNRGIYASGGTFAGKVESANGSNKTVINAGIEELYWNNEKAGEIASYSLYSTSTYGFSFITFGKFGAFGSASGSENAEMYYMMNNGVNPDGATERNIFAGTTRFGGDVRFNGQLYLGGARFYTGIINGKRTLYLNNSGLHVFGDIACSGTKQRAVETRHYGTVGMNAFETPTPYFADIGSGTIGSDGSVTIFFDPKFSETVDMKSEYQVLLTRTSEKETAYVKKENGYFTVCGEPGATFDWMLCAKQNGYEADRMEHVVLENPPVEFDEAIFYGDDGAAIELNKTMDNYNKEMALL